MGKNDGNKVVSDNWVSRKGDMKRYNKTIKQRTLDKKLIKAGLMEEKDQLVRTANIMFTDELSDKFEALNSSVLEPVSRTGNIYEFVDGAFDTSGGDDGFTEVPVGEDAFSLKPVVPLHLTTLQGQSTQIIQRIGIPFMFLARVVRNKKAFKDAFNHLLDKTILPIYRSKMGFDENVPSVGQFYCTADRPGNPFNYFRELEEKFNGLPIYELRLYGDCIPLQRMNRMK